MLMSPLVNKIGALKYEFYIDDVSNDLWAAREKHKIDFQKGCILTCVSLAYLCFKVLIGPTGVNTNCQCGF